MMVVSQCRQHCCGEVYHLFSNHSLLVAARNGMRAVTHGFNNILLFLWL